MIVVASAGLNLPRALIAYCQIEETPHPIVVDGALHDPRTITSYAVLQKWMTTARTPPYALGSSAPEYVDVFNKLIERTNEVLVVTGTRKWLGTYDAAVAATRIVKSTRKGLEVRVLDTGLAELGAGLIAAYCGAAARSRYDMATVLEAGQALAAASQQLCVSYSSQVLRRLGIAAQTSSILPGGPSDPPLIGMVDGEFRNLAALPKPQDAAQTVIEYLEQRHAPRSALWVTVCYAEDAAPARELLALVRQRFDVRYALLCRLSPAGYLFLGAKAVSITTHPVDAMKLMIRLPEVR